jgi:hypothetical protein
MWRYGPVAKEQRKLGDLLRAIEALKGTDVLRADVIRAYHIRKLASLMAKKLWMWEMMPDLVPEGTVMVFGKAITPNEVEDRLKDTLDRWTGQTVNLVIVYLVSGHPPMRSDAGFIELISYVAISFPANPILDLTVVVHSLIFMSESLTRRCQRTPRGGQRTTPRLRWRRQEKTRRQRGGKRRW